MKEAFLFDRDYLRAIALAAAALVGGLFNGFFGTGGGMILVLSLSALLGAQRGKEAFVISSFAVLAFSLASLALYGARTGAQPFLAFAPSAMLGGVLGALLFGRVGTHLLRKIFAILLIYSGLKLMGVF